MRVLYLQYTGGLPEALDRFACGEKENYYGQKYSVEEVLRIAHEFGETVEVCCVGGKSYDVVRPEGVRTIGLGLQELNRRMIPRVMNVCREISPTHAIVRFPSRHLISFLLKRGIQVFPVFADSFEKKVCVTQSEIIYFKGY